MCLIAIAYRRHPRYPLIIAANRDEFYRRPALPAAFWPDCPEVLAGKDLDQLGTWLGTTISGRFAALTNYRDPSAVKKDARSRGELVRNYLCGKEAPLEYLKTVSQAKDNYNGFNLLVGDTNCLLYYSNREDSIKEVTPGIHALSNHLLDTPWPKVEKAKARLSACLAEVDAKQGDNLFSMLVDSEKPPDDRLPHTGVSLEWERLLSSIFIESTDYGTRCSTVILQDAAGRLLFKERTMPDNKEVAFTFEIKQ